MKKTILLTLFVLSLLFVTACEIDTSKVDLSKVDTDKIIKCEAPYIRVGAECCVDQDDNKICDKDEIELENLRNEPQKETGEDKPKETPEDKPEKTCSNECSTDSCDGLNYVKCEAQTDGCKDEVNKGKVDGKCGVECKEIKVPYEAKETYKETECKPITEPADYSIELVECYYLHTSEGINPMCELDSGSIADYCRIDYIITNDAEEGGEFTFEIGPITNTIAPPRVLSPHMITKYIEAHSSEHFSKEFCCGPWIMEDCSIAPESIPTVDTGTEECEEVTKTRFITKYKNETVCE